MNKAEAAIALMRDYGNNQNPSMASAKRVLKACNVLGMSAQEKRDVLSTLEYLDQHGKPREWSGLKEEDVD